MTRSRSYKEFLYEQLQEAGAAAAYLNAYSADPGLTHKRLDKLLPNGYHQFSKSQGTVRKLIWVGSSYKNLKDFPLTVSNAVGYALYCAQMGKMHGSIKVLKGMGNASIREIRENDRDGTYRVVYTVEMPDFVFVLHAFQKKSKSGIATPKQEIELLKDRLREARILYKSLVVE